MENEQKGPSAEEIKEMAEAQKVANERNMRSQATQMAMNLMATSTRLKKDDNEVAMIKKANKIYEYLAEGTVPAGTNLDLI